jgi:hypothetical protein
MANYKNNNEVLFNKEIELRKLNEQLEAAKDRLGVVKDVLRNEPLFSSFLQGKNTHKYQTKYAGQKFIGTQDHEIDINPEIIDTLTQTPGSTAFSYRNSYQEYKNLQNQINQLSGTINAERKNLESLRHAETDQMKAETIRLKELSRIQEELITAKDAAKELQEKSQQYTQTLDPNSEEYQNLVSTQEQLAQNIQTLVDEREQIKGADPLQILNQNSKQNSNTQVPNQEGNVNFDANRSTLEYYNDSASILAKHPDLAAQYNKNKINNPRKALETLVENAYEKDIANGNTDNLIEYRNIIDKIAKEDLEQDIKERKAKAREEIEKANTNPNTGKQYTEEERKAALEAMLNSKEGYPTADMDHLTFAGKPIWHTNIAKNIAARTAQATSPDKPYPYYTKPRIAQPSKEETIAYDLLSKNLLKPEYEQTVKETIDDLKKLKEKSPTENLGEADERAKEKTTNENIEGYVNPKTNSVLDLIQKRAMRNFKENIMPKVSAPFIARGSFNTGARAEAQDRARRDLMESLMDNETQFLASAYDKARATASEDKRTYLNYQLNKANLQGDEILKKGKIAEDISKLMDVNHKNKLLDMEALRTVGQSQRDVEQRKLDLEHQEFENEVNYPIRQIDILNKMLHQLPVGSILGETSNKASPPTRNEQVSPWAQGANMAGSILAANMMSKAEGGMIQRHADGGMIDKMKDQYLQDLMTRAQNTGGNTQDPWAHYLMGLSSKLGTSSDVMQDLVKGNSQGLSQFMHAKEYNNGLEDQNLGFKKSIIDYLDQADERKMVNRLNEAKINYYNNKGNGSIKSAIPATVQRITAQTLKQLDNEAQIAKEENKLLPKSEESLEQMKEATSTFTKPGTLASKLVDEYKFLENIIYNEEAQKARQEIEKNNSLLIQNRAAPGTNPTDASRQIIASGMPRTTIQPEASAEIFRSKREQNTDKELRSKFIHEWVKQAGGDINGAQDAYNEFIRDKELLKNGKPNYEIMKEIPSAVYHYITETPFSIEQESNITSHNNEEYGFDPSDYDDIPDEVILHRLESGQ